MTQPNQSELDIKLDEILEELHNSWLEDDYEYDDPCGVKAKLAIQSLIRNEIAKVLDTIEIAVLGEVTDEEERYEVYTAIQAERAKLKEVK